MSRARLRRWGDPGLALAFALLAGVQIATDPSLSAGQSVGAAAIAAGVAAALWQRRSMPLLLPCAFLVSVALRPLVPAAGDGVAYGVPALLAAYTCARHLEGRALLVGGVLTVAMAVVMAIVDGGDLSGAIFYAILFATPWVIGRALRFSGQRQELLEDRARLLELQRDERARAAVAEERQRIARELHDVVAHAISVVLLQARGGRRSVASEPEDALAAFDAIERTSGQALNEMRRLLGLLRGDEEHPLLALPTLDRLEGLAEEVRASGLPVELTVEGAPAALPPGVDVSAYRIVQEALTNALKHAGPARARVRVAYAPDAVEIEVSDDGRGAVEPVAAGDGHGLVGIRERVAVVGGEVRAGPRPAGGYAVSARLPYAAQR